MGERFNRRAIVAALLTGPLFACGDPIKPPVLAMRFEVTRESSDAIGAALSDYAARERYKFETYQGDIDRSFELHNEYVRITMGAGAWNDAAYITHEPPFEYQVDFYPANETIDVEALAAEIGALLSSIPGVRKSGPNIYWQELVREAQTEEAP